MDTQNTAPDAKGKPTTKPFSIRLTNEERLLLLEMAGRVPLGTYIRDRVLAPDAQTIRRRWRQPVKDDMALAKVLAALGQSRLASNLNQLAKAANTGMLFITPETEAELVEACRSVSAMRIELVEALGLDGGASS